MPDTKVMRFDILNIEIQNFGGQDFDIPARYGMKKVEISSFGC